MTAKKAARKRLGFWAYFAIVAGLVAALLLVLAATLYIQRRSVAALIAQNYLRTLGVDSDISFSTLGMGGFLARVRAGKVDQPDFTAESMEVTFLYPNDGMTPALATVKLVRPFLRVSYDGKTLRFGSLQKLVDDALAQAPDGEGPAVAIEKGDLLLITPNGSLRFTADLTIANRRLVHLNASLQGGRLQGDGIEAVFSGGTVKADAQGEALNGSAALKLDSISRGADFVHGVELAADMRGLKWQDMDGATRFALAGGTLTLRSTDAVAPGLAAAGSLIRIAVESVAGDFSGGKLTAGVTGMADVQLTTVKFGAALAAARIDEHMDVQSADLNFANGNLRLIAHGASKVEMAGVNSGAASLEKLTLDVSIPEVTANVVAGVLALEGAPHILADGAGLRYRLKDGTIGASAFHADIAAKGATIGGKTEGAAKMSLSGRATIPRSLSAGYARSLGDPALTTAIADGLESVTVQMRDVAVTLADGISLTDAAPIVFDGARGAKITLSPQGGVPLVKIGAAEAAGGFALAVEGGGLPVTHLTLASYRYAGGALDADTEFETRLDLGYLRGLHVSGRGRLRSGGGRTAFDLSNCADLQFGALHIGAADYVTQTETQLCAAPMQPLLVSDAKGWRLDGGLTNTAAKFDTAGAALARGEGRVQLAGTAAGLQTGRIEVLQAQLSDAVMPARFLPVSATGAMMLADGEWRGDAAITARDRKLAGVAIRHRMATNAGSAAIDARNLVFAPNQLQPADIVPFLATFGTRVNGAADFTGTLAWSKDGITSEGRVAAAALDLQSKFGAVRRAAFDLKLDSLLPIAVAPRQAISAERIDTVVPLEKLTAQFSYTPDAFRLDSAAATVAEGRVMLDPLTYSFAPGATTRGVLHLENLNVAPLIDAAGLTGRVSADARIAGTVPFALTPEGVRFDKGRIAATAPGRLSIKREALTGGVGIGAENQAPPNAVQDFAYQALENMAFDALEGDIDSRPMGRLGMVFRIKGRNDPPVALETRVGVVELLRGEAFNRPLPLPKGTPVDLTLDTSLNLDELLKSYFDGFASAP